MIVMIGDSLTQGAEWEEIFPHVTIANRGIGGDTSADILRRMEPIFSVNARKAFLMVGTNDIQAGLTTNEILKNYIDLIESLQVKGIEVYIQSTLECNKSKCGPRLIKIRELNHQLKAYADIHNLPFININYNLTTESDGLLNKFTNDGIHLLGDGYLIWSKNLAPFMK
jgi:lysophospholipase L1-like esterase